jgi:hypothetical protein
MDATEKRVPLDRTDQPWPGEIRMTDEVRRRVAQRRRSTLGLCRRARAPSTMHTARSFP